MEYLNRPTVFSKPYVSITGGHDPIPIPESTIFSVNSFIMPISAVVVPCSVLP